MEAEAVPITQPTEISSRHAFGGRYYQFPLLLMILAVLPVKTTRDQCSGLLITQIPVAGFILCHIYYGRLN